MAPSALRQISASPQPPPTVPVIAPPGWTIIFAPTSRGTEPRRGCRLQRQPEPRSRRRPRQLGQQAAHSSHRHPERHRRRGIPNWPELTWSEVERVRGYYAPWREQRLTLDAIHSLAGNIERASRYARADCAGV